MQRRMKYEFCDGDCAEDIMQWVVEQPMLAQDTQCVQSLCTGRYDALYVQRYRQTIGKCDANFLTVCTRWSSGTLSGIENFVFRLWSVKIISCLFVKLSLRLLASAHSLTLCNSAERESTLTAGIMRCVSSRCLSRVYHSRQMDTKCNNQWLMN